MNYKDDIKAIAFDFDGTLIDFHYNASQYTKLAIEKLKNSKYKICLSSGRPCFLAKKSFEEVFGPYPLDYIFGCNGAEFLDVKKNETKQLYSIKAEDIRYIGNILDVPYLMMGIYDGDKFLVNHLIDSQEIMDWLGARWLKPIIYDYSKNDVDRSKVIVVNEYENRKIEKDFVSKLDLNRFEHAYSSNNCLEISPKGVNKGKAMDVLCEILKCKNINILSFGDNENDIPMLLNSTGVLMGNASDDLKKKVNLHTDSVDQKGIYEFLYNNGLI